jgi:hypothetical protein
VNGIVVTGRPNDAELAAVLAVLAVRLKAIRSQGPPQPRHRLPASGRWRSSRTARGARDVAAWGPASRIWACRANPWTWA